MNPGPNNHFRTTVDRQRETERRRQEEPAKPAKPPKPAPKCACNSPEKTVPPVGEGKGKHVAKYRVLLNGAEAPRNVMEDLREIVVDQATEMADFFVIALNNDGNRWSDKPTFRPGANIRIELGYEGDVVVPVMDGEVVSWKASYPRRGPSTLRVQGFTKYHRLKRPRLTRSFGPNKKYSDIAKEIAKECGLCEGIEDSGIAFEAVYQHNQTNLQFLLELARLIGFEVFVSGEHNGKGKLYFRKARTDKPSIQTLKWKENLIAFHPHLAVARIPTLVEVMAWSGARKEEIQIGIQIGQEGPSMGGTQTGPMISEKLGPARQLIVFEALYQNPEAEKLAIATLRRATMETVHAEATCEGAPWAQAGLVVAVEGVGPDFSGPYYIERAVHNLLPHGFTTTLQLIRTSTGKGEVPVRPFKPVPPKPRPLPPIKIIKKPPEPWKPELRNLRFGYGHKPDLKNLRFGYARKGAPHPFLALALDGAGIKEHGLAADGLGIVDLKPNLDNVKFGYRDDKGEAQGGIAPPKPKLENVRLRYAKGS